LFVHNPTRPQRGLEEGDVVRVFNEGGAFLAAVKMSADPMPGVVRVATGAWFDPESPGAFASPEKHGNPNVVTLDKGTSRLGQGSVAQTVLVQVDKCLNPPSVTAFDLPEFVDAS
jgi:biotin/methionine sulfoxide reductase